jgi:adenosylcobinamide kinase/adenosylcobinamide-phosphate guanylyltransferase
MPVPDLQRRARAPARDGRASPARCCLDPPADASGGAARLSTWVVPARRPAPTGPPMARTRSWVTPAAGAHAGRRHGVRGPPRERVWCSTSVASDGARLLWAPSRGVAPEATVEALALTAFDTVLLDVRTGADPIGFAHQVARLRRVGAVTASTDVLAVGVGHDAPPAAELGRLAGRGGAPAGRRHPARRRSRCEHGPGTRCRRTAAGGGRLGKSGVAGAAARGRTGGRSPATGARRISAEDPGVGAAGRRPPVPAAVLVAEPWRRTRTSHALSAAQAPVPLDSPGTWLTGALHRRAGARDRPDGGDRLGAEVDALVEGPGAAGTGHRGRRGEVRWAGAWSRHRLGRLFRAQLGRWNQRPPGRASRHCWSSPGAASPCPRPGRRSRAGFPASGGSDR